MKRLYIFVLLTFVLFVVFVNVISFATCFNKRQLTNFFYLSERTGSIAMLAEHIVFESGLVLKREPLDDILKYIADACEETGVDPLLVYSMVSVVGLDQYAIDYDGSIGYMRVKPHVLKNYPARDLYEASDNIYVGVSYLASILEYEKDIEKAINLYFKPNKSYGDYNEKVVYSLSKSVFDNYIGSLADNKDYNDRLQ